MFGSSRQRTLFSRRNRQAGESKLRTKRGGAPSGGRQYLARLCGEPLEDRRLLAAGDIEWIRQFGSVAPVFDMARAVDVDGNVYVAGVTGATLPGQVSAGGSDAFVRKYNAAGNEVWTRQFGSASLDDAVSVAVDSSGVYVAGITFGTLPGQASAGDVDAFVRKYDAAGGEVWTRQFGTSLLDTVSGISVDATGVYVAGRTDGILPGQASAGSQDAFVRKYDAAGNEVWTRQFGSSSVDDAFSVAVDASGVYVAGRTFTTLPGQTSAGSVDAFVRKYDAAGNAVWTRQFGSASSDHASSVSVDASGVYVAGGTDGALPGQASAGGSDAFVRKYDAAGNEVWTRQFGSTSLDEASSVSVDASGVYVAGATFGTLPGQASAGNLDAFVRKFDASGSEVWTRQFGTSSSDDATGVSADATGVYVAGRTGGTLPGQVSAGGDDAYVRKYDAAGNEVWTRQFGALDPVSDVARAVDSDGNVYVAGYTFGTLAGQVSAGGADVFVRKYDPAGNEVWTRQFGSSSFDEAWGISADASGVYVAGRTDGALPGQVSAGGPDAFIRKYSAAGSEVWTRQFGSSLLDTVSGISVDASGVYVAGGTDGALPGQASAGGSDAFVRKYDAAGNAVWTRQFGSTSLDEASSVSVDASGVYVAGSTLGTLPGQASAGNLDAFVRKFDAAGSEVWTRQFGSSSVDATFGISVHSSGVYVVGLTDGALPGQANAGGQDAFVRKYDAAGGEVWTRQFGTATLDQARGVDVDDSGVYVAGLTAGTLPGQAFAGITDAFVRKYDAAGGEVWTSQFGSSGADEAHGVSVDATGVYVAGLTGGTLPGQATAGFVDAFVAKLENPVNSPPTVASPIADVAVDEDALDTVINLHAAFHDAEDPDASLAYSITSNSGAALFTSTSIVAGQLTLDYAANENGTATIVVRATDPGALFVEDTFVVTVRPVNDTPTAVDDTLGSIAEDSGDRTISFSDLIGNDSKGPANESGQSLTIIAVGNAVGGTVGIVGADVVFSPVADYNGPASFEYTVEDDGTTNGIDDVKTDVGSVSFTITPVNDQPVANSQSVSVTEDGTIAITLSGSDVETAEADLTFQVTALPTSGVLMYQGNALRQDGLGGIYVDDGLNTPAVFTGPPTLSYEPGIGCDCSADDAFSFVVIDRGDPDDNPVGAAPLTSTPAVVSIQISTAVADGQVTIDAAGIVRIGGTAGDDNILVTRTTNGQFLQVTIDGVIVRDDIASSAVSEIRAWGRDGNDRIELVNLAINSLLLGGRGDDELIGGAGDDLIFGGAGNDKLTGAAGNDFLIGGQGADRVVGSAGNDVLVAGDVDCHFTHEALRGIALQWAANRTADDGLADDVLDEMSDGLDMLTGSSGADWFIVSSNDKVTDFKIQNKEGDLVTIV